MVMKAKVLSPGSGHRILETHSLFVSMVEHRLDIPES